MCRCWYCAAHVLKSLHSSIRKRILGSCCFFPLFHVPQQVGHISIKRFQALRRGSFTVLVFHEVTIGTCTKWKKRGSREHVFRGCTWTFLCVADPLLKRYYIHAQLVVPPVKTFHGQMRLLVTTAEAALAHNAMTTKHRWPTLKCKISHMWRCLPYFCASAAKKGVGRGA